MSATGSVNLIVCFSLSHPFAPRRAENLQRLAHQSFVVSRLSLACSLVVANDSTTRDQRRFYQDDFETPGISPRNASWRKHKRQMPNFRRKARGRPHSLQRLCLRVENLGFLASLTRFAVVAT
jgi:hypothetical protein